MVHEIVESLDTCTGVYKKITACREFVKNTRSVQHNQRFIVYIERVFYIDRFNKFFIERRQGL